MLPGYEVMKENVTMHEGHNGFMVQETAQEILIFLSSLVSVHLNYSFLPFFILFRTINHYLLNLDSYLHMYIHVAKKTSSKCNLESRE